MYMSYKINIYHSVFIFEFWAIVAADIPVSFKNTTLLSIKRRFLYYAVELYTTIEQSPRS